jgi:hypothetical protein
MFEYLGSVKVLLNTSSFMQLNLRVADSRLHETNRAWRLRVEVYVGSCKRLKRRNNPE